jgi:hypothetical protein
MKKIYFIFLFCCLSSLCSAQGFLDKLQKVAGKAAPTLKSGEKLFKSGQAFYNKFKKKQDLTAKDTALLVVMYQNTNPTDSLALIITDEKKQEVFWVFGNKDAQGNLVQITRTLSMYASPQGQQLIIESKLNAQGLPYQSRYSDGKEELMLQQQHDLARQQATYKVYSSKDNQTQTITQPYHPQENPAPIPQRNSITNQPIVNPTQQQSSTSIWKQLSGQIGGGNKPQQPTTSSQPVCNDVYSQARVAMKFLNFIPSGINAALTIEAPPLFAVNVVSAITDGAKGVQEGIGALANGGCLKDSIGTVKDIVNGCGLPMSMGDGLKTVLPELASGTTMKAMHSKLFNPAGCVWSFLDAILAMYARRNRADVIATTWGDPHLTTFDRLRYDFQTVGEFTLVESTTEIFEIQTRQEEIPSLNDKGIVSWVTGIAVNTGTDTICVFPKQKIYINKKPYTGKEKIIDIHSTNVILYDNYLLINLVQGDVIKIVDRGENLDFFITPSTSRQAKVRGLLGNYDGDKTNEKMLRDGRTKVDENLIKTYGTYTDNWRIRQENSLFVYDSGKTTYSYTDRTFPKNKVEFTPENLAWATKICKDAGIKEVDILEICTCDVAATKQIAQAARVVENTRILAAQVLQSAEEAQKILHEAKTTWRDVQNIFRD